MDTNELQRIRAAAADNDTAPEPKHQCGGMGTRLQAHGFQDIIYRGWGTAQRPAVSRSRFADDAIRRRDAIAALLPGERLVIPAGIPKTRVNDIDFQPFRIGTAFAYLTGLGKGYKADSVLVIDPIVTEDGVVGHHDVLYVEPPIDRSDPRFYSDYKHGEFWTGPQPTLADFAVMTGIETRDRTELEDALRADAGPDGVRLRLCRDVDALVDALVDQVRIDCGLGGADENAGLDEVLQERLGEIRLIKSPVEIEEMRRSVRATLRAFDRVADMLPIARQVARGERLLETVFTGSARYEGHVVAGIPAVASGVRSGVLHYEDNSGSLKDGDLVLIDGGGELDSLYTADITRTFPVNGRFTPTQRRVYDAVVASEMAGIEAASRPCARYRDIQDAVMASIAQSLHDMGILPVSVEEALGPDGQQQCRWLYHGTGHMLGIDMHDGQHARNRYYPDAELKPGMIFTIEPGLYFDADDLLIPEEYRGIGVRVEDDILITDHGAEVLVDYPRTSDEIEQWLSEHNPQRYLRSFLDHDSMAVDSDD
ncbi:Xaa-Pro aminopeptidase [Bifidobacterium ramosum]|uniref:Xaa-Pro aminopeptidase n=1 Tax=Bifidobacterium ramosum TaxID=1798158 RepID=A0A6L4WZR1_9BIFI|nr:aminopeptidase P family protein [Bifidobacterium ramosum]KAB8286608.1 Xaa-Pro aminopeptidase [Bifidobacterium ramosum]NEG72630.1 M24 family metallopeptidase [Bifidobacterium ramosum]